MQLHRNKYVAADIKSQTKTQFRVTRGNVAFTPRGASKGRFSSCSRDQSRGYGISFIMPVIAVMPIPKSFYSRKQNGGEIR